MGYTGVASSLFDYSHDSLITDLLLILTIVFSLIPLLATLSHSLTLKTQPLLPSMLLDTHFMLML